MTILKRLGLRARPVDTASRAAVFFSETAMYVTQKVAFGYVRARTGKEREKIMTEPVFQKRMDICRYTSAPVTLADLMILAFHRLQPAVTETPGARDALCDALKTVYRAALAHMGSPPIEAGWDRAAGAFAQRLERARGVKTRGLVEVFETSWTSLFATLPMAEEIRERDKAQIYASFRLWVIRAAEELDRRLAADDLIADLTGPARRPRRAS